MVIQHNLTAGNTNRQLGITNGNLQKTTEKLSSGYKINRAADNAAGLSISEKMRGQIRGLDQGSLNAQDGISLIQTAEGALNETHSILQRVRELTVQASNGTNTTTEVKASYDEVNQLLSEVTRIANQTEFNKKNILNGDLNATNSGLILQVGANANQVITTTIDNMGATSIFNNHLASFKGAFSGAATSATKARFSALNATLGLVDDAIVKVSTQRSTLGAIQNRLEHTIANADNTSENLQAAESRIRDTDIAKEMVKYSKDNILQQASQSVLAQANQATKGVLSLLQ
ncbi:flagellin N-terminal helical domain-containing protein [Anaerocolumna jejuensis]|uniref:flagellin N-terminal helical domain-containing protein n=1 Tax=Anaerocolumna jejuensis TaxID=259063 RepID=UPI003F7BCB1D